MPASLGGRRTSRAGPACVWRIFAMPGRPYAGSHQPKPRPDANLSWPDERSAVSLIPLAIILGGYGLVFMLPWQESPAGGRVNGGGMNDARQRAKPRRNLAVLRRPGDRH